MEEEKQRIELIKNLIQSRHPDFKLTCSVVNNKEIKIPITEISYIESDGTICRFFYHDSSKGSISVAKAIGECEKRLHNYAFIRVHRSYVVNSSCIQSITWEREGEMTLSCGKKIPIPRRRKAGIENRLNQLGMSHLINK